MRATTQLFVALCVAALLGAAVAVAASTTTSAAKKAPRMLTQEMVDYINAQKTTWRAEAGPMHKINPKVVVGMLGARPSERRLPEVELEVAADIPDTFDARQQWSNCTSVVSIRDQSACGSCWAFATAEAISDRICIASKGAQQPEISTEDLMSCCWLCGDGCNGGNPSAAWSHWVHTGLVTGYLYNSTEWCQNYAFPPCMHHVTGPLSPCPQQEYSTPKCSHECRQGYAKTYNQDKWFGKSAYSVSSVAKIQTEIMTNGPVGAAFTVYEDFPSYKSGVYQHTTGSALGGHAVKIVGWGVDNGTPYWIVANSWNQFWGQNGYFWIKRGSDECGIESDITAGLPKL